MVLKSRYILIIFLFVGCFNKLEIIHEKGHFKRIESRTIASDADPVKHLIYIYLSDDKKDILIDIKAVSSEIIQSRDIYEEIEKKYETQTELGDSAHGNPFVMCFGLITLPFQLSNIAILKSMEKNYISGEVETEWKNCIIRQKQFPISETSVKINIPELNFTEVYTSDKNGRLKLSLKSISNLTDETRSITIKATAIIEAKEIQNVVKLNI